MSIIKVKYGDDYIYINDEKINEKETDAVILNEDELEKTMEIKPIKKESLEDTKTDLWGENNEKV